MRNRRGVGLPILAADPLGTTGRRQARVGGARPGATALQPISCWRSGGGSVKTLQVDTIICQAFPPRRGGAELGRLQIRNVAVVLLHEVDQPLLHRIRVAVQQLAGGREHRRVAVGQQHRHPFRFAVGVPHAEDAVIPGRGQVYAVAAPGNGVDFALMAPQHRPRRAVGVPQPHSPMLVCRGQPFTIRTPGDRQDPSFVPRKHRPRRSVLVPQPHRAVAAR